jgi:hypothetical protein
MAGILDFLTGGADQNAQSDLANALANVQAVPTPTAAQLQLSPLQQYEMTGQLSPALMQAAQAGPSAFNAENISPQGISAMQQALAQLQGVASTQGMTPQEQAAISQAIQSANTATAGQRGAIQQQFANQGDPTSLISAALQNQSAGQNAQNEYLAALQGQGQAAQNALAAMSASGNLGQNLYQTQANQANTVAQAQNALQQFNAANTQQASAANQAAQMAANQYNTSTAQNLANQNVAAGQARQEWNQAQAPIQAANLALEKSGQEVGVGEAQSGQQMAQGQQSAGLFGGLLGAGATLGGQAMNSNATNNLASAIGTAAILAWDGKEMAEGGETFPPKSQIPATNFCGGGMSMVEGGKVPGTPRVWGDSPKNDIVPARLSPGEVVLPRTVTHNPGNLRNFLEEKAPMMASKLPPTPDHSDIKTVLRALAELRAGV